ncbi:ParA family protein [Lactobacillus xujianguonis]|uniref:ParA family protein n=1 Tax=Lactobacillus xujianguonis TaxID=2495899 RepID=A0A437SW32_9LACO|nr:AAA family ATPase [Lactobacillus xujianguonis]RVU71141.1 ParA family protein [Lactobacillus xujianguonis]RVU77488.1 ParA family protein [Lactobacillus xujianguonis]
MKIISFAAIKGGVGKTTLAYNFGERLAKNGKKILFIDLDHQCNLSQTYEVYADKDIGTVANIFLQEDNVTINHVKENIDLIAGNMHLDDIETNIENMTNKNMRLYMWLNNNYDKVGIGDYDYIIIDCHPDFSTATKNAIIVSHDILSPITPSKHGFDAKYNLEDRIEDLRKEAIEFSTGETYVTAKLYFIANMIKRNTSSSNEMLESIKDDDSVIAVIPDKELFNRSNLDETPVVEMMEDTRTYNRNYNFFQDFNKTFKQIEDKL